MRYSTILFCILVVLVSQDIFASAKTDSINAFLDGAHAKFVWPRWAWCNDDYTPKTPDAALADGFSLMLLDTRTGTERTLLTGQGPNVYVYPRISRSGKWVVFIDDKEKKTYIVDLTTSSPERKTLLDFSAGCAYWRAGAWWVDPENGDEYVFALENGDLGIYKVKVNADGTAALPGNRITINSNNKVDPTFSISADGTKMATAVPWPDTYILDVPTGDLIGRHHPGSAFGCQPNIAPDNSYRFFHCEDDHLGVYMFPPDMGTDADWFFNPSINLAGVPNPDKGTAMDFFAPRWTNHAQYYTAHYPMGDNYGSFCKEPDAVNSGDDDKCGMSLGMYTSLWTQSAEWVQTEMSMLMVPQFFMGKFSADFREQEKSILIASDRRYFQYAGDGWICSGTTYGDLCGEVGISPSNRAERIKGLSVAQNGAFVNIRAHGSAMVSITDAQGRLVRWKTGSGSIAVDTRDLANGAYIVSAQQHGNRLIQHVTIVR